MILIDASVLVEVPRDGSKESFERLATVIGDDEIAIAAHTQLELLCGARDAREWRRLSKYIESKTILEPTRNAWSAAAQMYFDLRRKGQTVRSLIDVCIAQIAIENNLLLLHNDRDFTKIALVSKLRHQQLQTKKQK